jgi:hypothetical protein
MQKRADGAAVGGERLNVNRGSVGRLGVRGNRRRAMIIMMIVMRRMIVMAVSQRTEGQCVAAHSM